MNRLFPCFILLTFTLSFIFPDFSFAQKKETIVVAEFVGRNVSLIETSVITDFVRSALVETDRFRVVSRVSMDRILAEQKFQLSGCTNPDCAAEIGKILNAEKIVIGSLTLLGGIYYLNIKMVAIETGEIVYTCDGECESPREFKSTSKNLTRRMAEFKVEPAFSLEGAGEVLERLEGEIIDVRKNDEVIINIGSNDGLKAGDVLTIFKPVHGNAISPIDRKRVIRAYEPYGELELIYSEPERSLAKIVGKIEEPEVGWGIKKGQAGINYNKLFLEEELRKSKENLGTVVCFGLTGAMTIGLTSKGKSSLFLGGILLSELVATASLYTQHIKKKRMEKEYIHLLNSENQDEQVKLIPRSAF